MDRNLISTDTWNLRIIKLGSENFYFTIFVLFVSIYDLYTYARICRFVKNIFSILLQIYNFYFVIFRFSFNKQWLNLIVREIARFSDSYSDFLYFSKILSLSFLQCLEFITNRIYYIDTNLVILLHFTCHVVSSLVFQTILFNDLFKSLFYIPSLMFSFWKMNELLRQDKHERLEMQRYQ